MAYNHHRRSIRLKGFDYAQPGGYFITICTVNREYLFGTIVDGKMRLNALGKIVAEEWNKTSSIRANVELDAFVVMPNHIHGIIILNDDGGITSARSRRGELQFAPTRTNPKFKSPSQTIGAIVRGFKSATTKRINALRNTYGVPLWQRNYYEHIMRGEKDYNAICEYILNNPLQWQYDSENNEKIIIGVRDADSFCKIRGNP